MAGGHRLLPNELSVLFELVNDRDISALHAILNELSASRGAQEVYRRLLQWRLDRVYGTRLACIIYACDITNPFTERQVTTLLADRLSEQSEDWMLLESGLWGTAREIVSETDMIATLKHFPPPDETESRKAFATVPLIALAGDGDPYLSLKSAEASFRRLASQTFHHFEAIEGGGHFSGLLPSAADHSVQMCQKMLKLKVDARK